MLDLMHYTPEHRLELGRLLDSPAWQEVLHSGLVDEIKAGRIEPGHTRDFIDSVVGPLLAFNRERVKAGIADGCRDEERLFTELARWPDHLRGDDARIAFLGLNVTADCNLDPRCAYCNQPFVPSSVDLDGWKGIVAEATRNIDGGGPYIYLTGGEPLVLGEAIWGDKGIVRFATERGAGVNINTNALLLTPEVALRLIKAGLRILHISLDTADPVLQCELRGGESLERILQGIYNVQLARELVGVFYPLIHTNCVLTNKNLDLFPQLFAFLLARHKQTVDRDDPLYNDLFPHVIPVGGSSNAGLRPSAEEFRRFYQEVWAEVCRVWADYQDRLGMPQEKRGALFGYFSNPFLRVEHEGGLEAYVLASAEAQYGKLALSQRCYVAPTQAAITSDGYQHYCGAHAIHRILPIGNVCERGIHDSIREGGVGLEALPREEHCAGCAMATLYINQATESRLKKELRKLLEGTGDAPTPAATDEKAAYND